LTEHILHHPVNRTCVSSFLSHFVGCSRSFKLISLVSCLATSFTHPLTLLEREKRLNRKTVVTYRSLTTIVQMLTTTSTLLQARQKSKWKVREGLVSTVQFVFTMENTTNPWCLGLHEYLQKVKQNFPLNQNLICTNYGSYVQSRRRGGFWGLGPPNKAPTPQIEL